MWKKKFCAGGGGALLFLVICVGFIVLVYLDSEEDPSLQVILSQGTLKGQFVSTRKGRHILSFQRIPYARTPVGDLRFQTPKTPVKWSGLLDATQTAPKCMQKNVFSKEQQVSGQEDCLFINVYTPHIKGHHLLDVMVYIHGGSWMNGAGSDYRPMYLLDKDIVLVTFNYRLGSLGFLSTGDENCPGNNGLKDQVQALKWVRKNIAAFGGNPGSVTIFGQSAGGASVHYHMLSSVSKGLFHRAISQSGTALCAWAFASQDLSRHKTEKIANLLDCPTQPTSDLMSCLRSKDAADIIKTDTISTTRWLFYDQTFRYETPCVQSYNLLLALAFEALTSALVSGLHRPLSQGHRAVMTSRIQKQSWSLDSIIPFRPVIEPEGDGAFLTADPLQLIRNLNSVPWITGMTSEEGAMVCRNETSPRKDEVSNLIRHFYFGNGTINNDTVTSVVNMYTDSWFLRGIDQAASLHSETSSAPVYYYYFNFRGSKSFSSLSGNSSRDYGVSHADDIIYLFPMEQLFGGKKLTDIEESVIDTMTTLWTNFARTGNPTPTGFKGTLWSRVSSPHNKQYVELNSDGLSPKQGLLQERVDFWNFLPLETSVSKNSTK